MENLTLEGQVKQILKYVELSENNNTVYMRTVAVLVYVLQKTSPESVQNQIISLSQKRYLEFS